MIIDDMQSYAPDTLYTSSVDVPIDKALRTKNPHILASLVPQFHRRTDAKGEVLVSSIVGIAAFPDSPLWTLLVLALLSIAAGYGLLS